MCVRVCVFSFFKVCGRDSNVATPLEREIYASETRCVHYCHAWLCLTRCLPHVWIWCSGSVLREVMKHVLHGHWFNQFIYCDMHIRKNYMATHDDFSMNYERAACKGMLCKDPSIKKYLKRLFSSSLNSILCLSGMSTRYWLIHA